jgi:ribosome-interacting GTPase 1
MASLNASPEYYAAEGRCRAAKTPEEKMAALQEMLSLCPKHKSAQSILMEIRNKMARLRKEQEKEDAKKKASKSGARGESIRKQGFQAVLVGPANGGKTALFNALTGKKERSTPVQFETTKANPGISEIKKVRIQVIDTPSMSDDWRGRILGLVRASDIAVGVFASEAERKAFLQDAAIIADKVLPLVRGTDYDLAKPGTAEAVKEKLFAALGIVRAFTKPPGGAPDYERPIALRKGATVREAAKEISKDIAENFKFAKVWGSTKFQGQQVGADYVLADGDVVEFHSR